MKYLLKPIQNLARKLNIPIHSGRITCNSAKLLFLLRVVNSRRGLPTVKREMRGNSPFLF